MICKIIIGKEPYIINKNIKAMTKGYEEVYTTSFTSSEMMLLRQNSIFGGNAIIINAKLSSSEEKELIKLIDSEPSLPGMLIYIPKNPTKKILSLDKKIIRINKPNLVELRDYLEKACIHFGISYEQEQINFLIEYSEYYMEEKVSLYDLIGLIKSLATSELTNENIKNKLIRPEKEDTFKIIQYAKEPEKLIEYMKRLSSNPYGIIGSLMYAFRVMAKLKITDDINVSSYFLTSYKRLSDEWTLNELINKYKLLNKLKEEHESSNVIKALVIYALIE